MAEQLERLNRNGQTLSEKTSSQQERELVTSTCSSLTDQLGHLRHLLEQRKMSTSEAIDAWQKFLELHSAVGAWCGEKREQLSSLEQDAPRRLGEVARRAQEMQAALKSARYAGKNLQEMARELGRVEQVVDVPEDEKGGMREKMAEAEQAKADIEGKITEKVNETKIAMECLIFIFSLFYCPRPPCCKR